MCVYNLNCVKKKCTEKKKIQTHKHNGKHMSNVIEDFPAGTVDKSTPTNAGDTCLIPGLGGIQMLRSN